MFFSNIQNPAIRKALNVIVLCAFVVLIMLAGFINHQNNQLAALKAVLEAAVSMEAPSPPAVQVAVTYDDAAILSKLDEHGRKLENMSKYILEGVPVFTSSKFEDFALQLEGAGLEPRALVRYSVDTDEQFNGTFVWPVGMMIIQEYEYESGAKDVVASVPAGSTVIYQYGGGSGEEVTVDAEPFRLYVFLHGGMFSCRFGAAFIDSCENIFSFEPDI